MRFLLALGATLALGCGSATLSGFGGDGVSGESVGGKGDFNPGTATPGGYGATPGGAQDIGYARQLIENGQVPPADSMTVEGLLSEHDIPIEGAPCTGLLCARPATAWAPSIETGKSERWIQIGMASGLQNFVRPPLDVVVVMDASGSMSGDMVQTNEAVARMVDKLRDGDRIAVLTFQDAVSVVQPFGAPGDRVALKNKIKAIQPGGGSNMMKGLTDGFAIAKNSGNDPKRLRRVMVLSCGYPDSQTQGASSFVGVVEENAKAGIGFSFYGILLGFEYNLANKMSQSRGGTYSYVNDLQKIEKLFDTDFDFMVTPIAYDLQFALTLPGELEVSRVYGIPGDPNGSPKTMFDVKTAFISRRKGAIVVRVKVKDGQQAGTTSGDVKLSYTPERAVMDQPSADATTSIAGIPASENPVFSGKGVRKAVFLVNQLEGMKKACALYHAGDKVKAKEETQKLLDYMKPEAATLADSALDPEIKLVEKLLSNMK